MKSYYVLSNGRVRRHQNTLWIEKADGGKNPIPVEDVDSLYVYGEVDINTRLLAFLSQKRIPLHVFNYYGFYSGSYYPREFLHSGHLVVTQAAHYSDPALRLALAKEIVRGSAHSLLRNIAYYERRRGGGAASGDDPVGEVGVPVGQGASGLPASPRVQEPEPNATPTDEAAEEAVDGARSLPPSALPGGKASDGLAPVLTDDPFADTDPFEDDPLADDGYAELGPDGDQPSSPATISGGEPRGGAPWDPGIRQTIQALAGAVDDAATVDIVRGLEGKMRERYYAAWPSILQEGWVFERRVRRPPDNEINALISFGNGVLYSMCLGELYRTQMTPTISYLHEPGARRFSLALDLSEMFKPLIVDRTIFRLVNRGQITPKHFDKSLNGCFLADPGKQLFLRALDESLNTTIRHRRLGRHVSYRHLIRLECYKLIRHMTGIEEYHAFRAWW